MWVALLEPFGRLDDCVPAAEEVSEHTRFWWEGSMQVHSIVVEKLLPIVVHVLVEMEHNLGVAGHQGCKALMVSIQQLLKSGLVRSAVGCL